jgi:hypothetical protein
MILRLRYYLEEHSNPGIRRNRSKTVLELTVENLALTRIQIIALQMTDSRALQPLASNVDKDNIQNSEDRQYDVPSSRFDLFSKLGESTSVINGLTAAENSNLNDENVAPGFGNLKLDNFSSMSFDMGRELSNLKAELETTRRKLAEYEARSNDEVVPNSSTFGYSAESRSPLFNSTSFGLSQKDIVSWPQYSTISESSSPADPLSIDFPTSASLLHLPSSTSFQTHDVMGGVNSGRVIRSSTYFNCR